MSIGHLMEKTMVASVEIETGMECLSKAAGGDVQDITKEMIDKALNLYECHAAQITLASCAHVLSGTLSQDEKLERFRLVIERVTSHFDGAEYKIAA